jgi:hypothetical protein
MQRPGCTGTDPVVEQPAGRGHTDYLEFDVLDPQPGTGAGRDVAGIDGQIAPGGAGIDRVPQIRGGLLEQFP